MWGGGVRHHDTYCAAKQRSGKYVIVTTYWQPFARAGARRRVIMLQVAICPTIPLSFCERE
jgi:hypothetical protein